MLIILPKFHIHFRGSNTNVCIKFVNQLDWSIENKCAHLTLKVEAVFISTISFLSHYIISLI